MSYPERPRILLVDDEPSVCQALSQALLQTSQQHPAPMAASVTIAHNTTEALALIDHAVMENRLIAAGNPTPAQSCSPLPPWDQLLVDMCLGEQSGLDLLRELRGRRGESGGKAGGNGSGTSLPCLSETMGLVLLTGRASPEQMSQAIRLGVDDLLLKPLTLQTLREAITRCYERVCERRLQLNQLRDFADELLLLRSRTAEAATNLASLQSAVLEALLAALAVREPGAVLHSLRVQSYTAFFARSINYPETLRPQLEHAALLHDIGKIGLSDMVLFHPDALVPSELERMHPHALLGEQILSRIGFLRTSALIVRHHHEHFDGNGYPDGLAGEDIPLGSRIYAIMDALDALTTDRPYRPAGTFQDAREEILRCAGQQFDPRLCELFARIPVASWQQISQQVEQRFHARESILPATVATESSNTNYHLAGTGN